jgi:hypothetical protein
LPGTEKPEEPNFCFIDLFAGIGQIQKQTNRFIDLGNLELQLKRSK